MTRPAVWLAACSLKRATLLPSHRFFLTSPSKHQYLNSASMPCYPDRRSLPPCPDPDMSVLVETKEGVYWRRKRSKERSATNKVLQANESLMKRCSPAAKKVLTALAPYRTGF